MKPKPEPTEAALVLDVRRRLGVAPQAEAARALACVCDALGDVLTDDEARDVAERLPAPLASRILARDHRHADEIGLRDLVATVVAEEGVDRGMALEQLTAVVEAMTPLLTDDLRARLTGHLPLEIAALFEPRPTGPPPDHPLHEKPVSPDILATGRPGSRHSIAEARPEVAHRHSVARSDEPHADRKLSSGSQSETLSSVRNPRAAR